MTDAGDSASLTTRAAGRLLQASRHLWNSLSFLGIIFGTLFFAASVTPSLLPRTFVVQGILSGIAIAAGYGFGVLLRLLWEFLELPQPGDVVRRRLVLVTSVASACVFVVFLNRMTFWQNSIRELMQMPLAASAYPLQTALLAIALGLLLIGLGRLLLLCMKWIDRRLKRFVPRKISLAVSSVVVLVSVQILINDVVASQLLDVADSIFHEWDTSLDTELALPTDDRCGSEASLIGWHQVGRQGKHFLLDGPTADDITAFSDRPAIRPIRVYAGIGSGRTLKARAEIALEELKRQDAFSRRVLVIATATGTGWIDPSAADTVEYLHDGDTAIVSIQYSYLPSWMTLIVDPERSRQAARALFQSIYEHWVTIPKEDRPQLYVFGLSLGALGAESSVQLWETFDDPVQGVLLSGPPSPSHLWAQVTRNRNPGSPMWKPEVGNGSVMRFSGQSDSLQSGKAWKSMRWVYLQYASDPMVFCSPDLLWQEPDWLKGQRGPDVSPHLRWYPVITFLQVAFDLPLATSVPLGYGHNYSPATYINGWNAVTDPEWSPEELDRLKQHFRRG